MHIPRSIQERGREMEDSHFRRGNCWMLREQVRQPCTLVREPMLGRGEASSMFRALKMIIEQRETRIRIVKRALPRTDPRYRNSSGQVSRLVFASPLPCRCSRVI